MRRLLLIAGALASVTSLTAQSPTHLYGDFNGDGKITVEDVTHLVDIVLGVEEPAEIVGDFRVAHVPYLTFEADGAQTLTMSKAVETVEYSVGGGDWTPLGTRVVTFGGTNGNLRLRGKSLTGTATGWITGKYSQLSFGNSTEVCCTGDLRTLVDYVHYDSVDCSNARFCYLFANCSSLVTAPSLPATHLATFCYSHLFAGCKSLASAPSLPAMELAEWCYHDMFVNCTSLSEAPSLPATTLATGCYYEMFGNTPLLTAPALPSQTLAESCYQMMFVYCTSLTEAPDLPAPTLAVQSYNNMFTGCSQLSRVKMLATDISASYCLGNWLKDVSATGTLVRDGSAAWDAATVIPSGWTVQDILLHNGHEYADIGITDWGGNPIYLATCNIGADQPWEVGQCFAWGETTGYPSAGTGTSADGHSFDWAHYQWCEGTDHTMTKYCNDSMYGTQDTLRVLKPADDAASACWGGSWRMPTDTEQSTILSMCFWQVTHNYRGTGTSGYILYKAKAPAHRGARSYNSTYSKYYTEDDPHVFLPSLSPTANTGLYWSSSLDIGYPNNAADLYFSDQTLIRYSVFRSSGLLIRPIYKPIE